MRSARRAFGANTLFVLADGARARLVRRTPAGGFATFAEVDGRNRLAQLRRELRASPPPANRQSGTPVRHSLGRSDYVRRAKAAFVESVADEAVQALATRGFDAIVLAAPARLIGPLRERLGERTQISVAISRDLTKSPDRELPRWLDHVWEPD